MSDPAGFSDDDPFAPEAESDTNPELAGAANLDPADELPAESDLLVEPEIIGDGWSGADIEEAYLKALSAMEELSVEEDPPAGESIPLETIPATEPATPAVNPPTDVLSNPPIEGLPGPAGPVVSQQPASVPAGAPLVSGPRLARGTDRPPKSEVLEDYSNVSPAQVIEAAMFVGGAPLTARKIVGMLRGSFDTAFVEQTIEDLNSAYLAQARPYEIRHGEGGYRLELRPEYDRLRHRVYGSGPREVRLAQDVLEVLALIAYRQPIAQKEIESHGKQNAGNLIRQLLRRDLIAFERGPGGRKDLQYQTTPRFLSVFGIASLDELPQAEDLAKK
jgi:segregation and condensation protein B